MSIYHWTNWIFRSYLIFFLLLAATFIYSGIRQIYILIRQLNPLSSICGPFSWPAYLQSFLVNKCFLNSLPMTCIVQSDMDYRISMSHVLSLLLGELRFVHIKWTREMKCWEFLNEWPGSLKEVSPMTWIWTLETHYFCATSAFIIFPKDSNSASIW